MTAAPRPARRVAVVTLGCARNEVDSEELAGRLAADGYELVDDAEGADAVLVNTCGFIETAKKDSVDAILAATDSGAEVVAVGCMAERYGSELAGALPEATVLGARAQDACEQPCGQRLSACGVASAEHQAADPLGQPNGGYAIGAFSATAPEASSRCSPA